MNTRNQTTRPDQSLGHRTEVTGREDVNTALWVVLAIIVLAGVGYGAYNYYQTSGVSAPSISDSVSSNGAVSNSSDAQTNPAPISNDTSTNSTLNSMENNPSTTPNANPDAKVNGNNPNSNNMNNGTSTSPESAD